jgi:hypothetical protein
MFLTAYLAENVRLNKRLLKCFQNAATYGFQKLPN